MSLINDTLFLLHRMGMESQLIKFKNIEFEEDGTETHTIGASLIDNANIRIENSPRVKCLLVFFLLDSWIDTTFPDLEGQSYRYKYTHLPINHGNNLIIREVFRISKLLRNTLIHSPSQFIFKNEILTIDYLFKNTRHTLTIPVMILNLLYSLITMYIKEENKNEYFQGVVRYVYMDILNGIKCFSDDFDIPLECSIKGVKIKPYNRNRIKNIKHERKTGYLKIITPSFIKRIESNIGLDFHLEIDNVSYLIPKECLTDECLLAESELHYWKIL